MEQDKFVFVDAASTHAMYNTPAQEVATVNIIPRMEVTRAGKLLVIPYGEG